MFIGRKTKTTMINGRIVLESVSIALVHRRRRGAVRDWIEARDLRYAVVATKIDKLSASARGKLERDLRKTWRETAAAAVVLSSSQTGAGIRELWREVDLALAGASAQG